MPATPAEFQETCCARQLPGVSVRIHESSPPLSRLLFWIFVVSILPGNRESTAIWRSSCRAWGKVTAYYHERRNSQNLVRSRRTTLLPFLNFVVIVFPRTHDTQLKRAWFEQVRVCPQCARKLYRKKIEALRLQRQIEEEELDRERRRRKKAGLAPDELEARADGNYSHLFVMLSHEKYVRTWESVLPFERNIQDVRVNPIVANHWPIVK